MLDLPIQFNQSVTVQECVQEVSIATPMNIFALSVTDLSFYDSLGAGFCSGDASSGPGAPG